MYPSTVETVKHFVATQLHSNVPSREVGVEGQIVDYDSSSSRMGLGGIHTSLEEFQEADRLFKAASDGTVSREYWDNPEFAEKQRREIIEGKRRRGLI